jgi:hypothetical protein
MEAMYEQACRHCAYAGHTTGEILGMAITSGTYEREDPPVQWPGQTLSPTDDAVQHLLARTAAATSGFISCTQHARSSRCGHIPPLLAGQRST